MKRPVVKLSVLPLQQQTETHGETEEKTTREQDRKRQKANKCSSFITMLMTFLYVMATITTGYCYNITSLNDRQGIYFDKLANLQLIRDEWNIITYYDLSPYWEGTTAYQKYYTHLEKVCESIHQLTHCDIIMLQLRHAYNELEHNNKVLLNHHISARARRRRGLINGVGYLANSLFGVLDDRFAEQYTKDIDLVRKNQKHLALLWMNQTSIIEAEHNLFKRTEEAIQKQHKIVNRHLQSLEKSMNTVGKYINEAEAISEFSLSAMAANNLLTHLRHIQDNLLDTITSVYNGNLNVHLIDPQQLQKELGIISGQLAKELTLPLDNLQTNMPNIYHLLKVRTKMTDRYLILEIKVPLTSRDNYDLYNIVATPRQISDKMISIIPIESHVAINLQKDSYIPISKDDLLHCLSRDPSTYLCQLKTPIYRLESDTNLCVKDHNVIPPLCKTVTTACQNQWIALSKVNQYLHFCCDSCQLRNLCKDKVTSQQVKGTNLIQLQEDCVVKTENFTVYAYKRLQSNINIMPQIETVEIAPINHIINISIPKISEDNVTYPRNEKIQEIEEKIKDMKKEPVLSENLSFHDVHHYTSLYILWGIVTSIALAYACQWLRRRRQTATTEAQDAPVAAGRAAETRPRTEPRPVACRSSSESEKFSARVQVTECSESESYLTERGTSPVLKKIAFSDAL